MRAISTTRAAAVVLVASASLLLATSSPVFGAPTPDPTFGQGGLVINPASGQYHDVVAMPDGGVVAVAGGADVDASDAPGLLVRYDASGALVQSFGSAGTETIARAGYRIAFTHVEHGSGGMLVAFGGYAHGSSDCGIAIARVDGSTGAPDPTFATTGLLLRSVGTRGICTSHVLNGDLLSPGGTVLPDGRLVAVHSYSTGSPRNPTIGAAVVMVDRNGAPSTAFGGTSGQALVALPGWAQVGSPQVASDGRVVVAVASQDPTTSDLTSSIGALRLLPSGSRDLTFGRSGLALRHPFGFFSAPGTVALVLQSGGRVVAAGGLDRAGFFDEYQDDTAVLRFTASGGPDPTFTNVGQPFARIPVMFVNRAVRAADGSLLLVGAENDGPLMGNDPLSVGRLAHVSANGVPDLTFGPKGVMNVIDAGTNQSSQQGLAISATGALTLAGLRTTNPDPNVESRVATLTRLTSTAPVRRTAAIESGLSGAYGIFRSCGTTVTAPCTMGTTWYFMGNAWPMEQHDPPRVVTQLQRRQTDGSWGAVQAGIWTATDTGNFRGAGHLTSVGVYRIRAAVPLSAATNLSYGAWQYFRH